MTLCLTISDFNIHNFNAYLCHSEDFPRIKTIDAPFGQVQQLLMDDTACCWSDFIDVLVVWTQPQAVIQSILKLLNYEEVQIDLLLKEVDMYIDMLLKIKGRAKTIIVPTWVLPTYDRGMGVLDFKHNFGLRNILSRINLRLSERVSNESSFFIMDTHKWIENAGKNAFNPKLWYMGKIPFGNEVFKKAAEDVKTVIRAISGCAKKLILLDLDDTLWGGIVGDVGKDNLILGGHDPEGEALVDFQKALKALMNRGVLLGIVSKNEEAIALEAIQHHPEMVLKLEDFTGWRINWDDKAKNVLNLVDELNLGLNAVVFIDDNPVERARVREALPDVYVPEWPQDKTLYRKSLLEMTCFDLPSLTVEDRERTKMYTSERGRKSLMGRLISIEDWLRSLEVTVDIEELSQDNLVRAAQLLNKTNQMNLSTRRLTETELMKWAQKPMHKILVFRVSDKFGASGLTGILGLEHFKTSVRIIDFVLSCRVMGRKVEETMLATAINLAKKNNAVDVIAEYLPTKKNKPCLEFFKRCGFSFEPDKLIFHWDTDIDYPFPPQICIRGMV